MIMIKVLGKEEEIVRFKGEFTFESNECLNCKSCSSKKETVDEIIERVKQNARNN